MSLPTGYSMFTKDDLKTLHTLLPPAILATEHDLRKGRYNYRPEGKVMTELTARFDAHLTLEKNLRIELERP